MKANIFSFLQNKKISRKDFLKFSFKTVLSFIAANALFKFFLPKAYASAGRPKRSIKGSYDLVVAKGSDPYLSTIKAVAAIGGMSRFVKKGDTVVVKPNIGWDRTPEQAGNTNPMVVAALVELCYKAGAKRVNVFDLPCNDARRCYATSGIEAAAKEKGAYVYFADKWNTLEAGFTYKSPMQGWPILRDAVECDTFINVPILKHHGLTGLTLSMKNLMGVCGGNRGSMHGDIGVKLADVADFIKPELTVIDAHRVLLRNGPTGGDLADVETRNTVIVGTDFVLADAYAAQFMGYDPMAITYIKEAAGRNLGSADIAGANITNIVV